MATGRKTYRTANGKPVDFDLLIQRNELTPAVGNARVNARGDELGAGGKIIRKREEVMKDYYRSPNAVPDEIPIKATVPDPIVVKEETKPTRTTTKKDPVKIAEEDATDDWVEDASGNFDKKGV